MPRIRHRLLCPLKRSSIAGQSEELVDQKALVPWNDILNNKDGWRAWLYSYRSMNNNYYYQKFLGDPDLDRLDLRQNNYELKYHQITQSCIQNFHRSSEKWRYKLSSLSWLFSFYFLLLN